MNSQLKNQRLEREMHDYQKLRIFIVYEISRRKDFRIIDLHYLQLPEAEQVLFVVFDDIQTTQENDGGNSKHDIKVIVGRGNHSKHGPVLLPYFAKNLKKMGANSVVVKDGYIDCRI